MADQKITADDPELENDQPEAADGQGPIEEEGEGGSPTPEKEVEDKEPVEEPVPVRKSAAQHIIARQKRTIEKLRSREEEPEFADPDDEQPVRRDEVAREVSRQVEPLIKTFATKVDEDELADLFAHEPAAKKYEKRIRTYMEHPAYQNVPPVVIFNHLSAKDKRAEGERRKKTADVEAAQARGAGTAHRPATARGNIPTVEELEDMDDTAFEELQHKVRSGAFISK